MDIRVQKTRRSITNAFLELRAKKPLEKITVRELCERAEINKSTFYAHFHDVYDLSDQLENKIIQNILHALPHPDCAVREPKAFTADLFTAFDTESRRMRILFSGDTSGRMIEKLYAAIGELIFQTCPRYRDNPFFRIYLRYATFGGYYAALESSGTDRAVTAAVIGQINEFSSRLLFQNGLIPAPDAAGPETFDSPSAQT